MIAAGELVAVAYADGDVGLRGELAVPNGGDAGRLAAAGVCFGGQCALTLAHNWIRYDPLPDAVAWPATLALLDATLAPATLSPGRQIAHEARAPAAIH